mgnify:CR=1 FL=1
MASEKVHRAPETVSKRRSKVRAKTGAYVNMLGCGFRVRATCANVLADIIPNIHLVALNVAAAARVSRPIHSRTPRLSRHRRLGKEKG